MSYYFSKIKDASFDEVLTRVADKLKKEGFGIIPEIGVRETVKKNLNINFQKYKLLCAYDTSYTNDALQIENPIGSLLPGNMIMQELCDGKVRVTAFGHEHKMHAAGNTKLENTAEQIQAKLCNVINSI
jgi:uncharacterized protein (DUF302 family)